MLSDAEEKPSAAEKSHNVKLQKTPTRTDMFQCIEQSVCGLEGWRCVEVCGGVEVWRVEMCGGVEGCGRRNSVVMVSLKQTCGLELARLMLTENN